MSDTFQKLATELATAAVTNAQNNGGFIKQAGGFSDFLNSDLGRVTAGGLGGAGLGALVGAMQPRRKGRNALYYGALGGLAGAGAGGLYNYSLGTSRGTPPPDVQTKTPDPVSNIGPTADQTNSLFDDVSGNVKEDKFPRNPETGEVSKFYNPNNPNSKVDTYRGNMNMDNAVTMFHENIKEPYLKHVDPVVRRGVNAAYPWAIEPAYKNIFKPIHDNVVQPATDLMRPDAASLPPKDTRVTAPAPLTDYVRSTMNAARKNGVLTDENVDDIGPVLAAEARRQYAAKYLAPTNAADYGNSSTARQLAETAAGYPEAAAKTYGSLFAGTRLW